MKKDQKRILKFLHEAEKLKSVLRHSWLSSGRRESTAEHTWRMALMAMLLHPYLKKKPDLFKIMRMILVHDLAEIYAGDVSAWKTSKAHKAALEERAMEKLSIILPKQSGTEIKKLWLEYESNKSAEAKFAHAIDRLEAKLQHQEADFKHLNKTEIRYNLIGGKKECEYDPFLQSLWESWTDNWRTIYKKNNVPKSLYE